MTFAPQRRPMRRPLLKYLPGIVGYSAARAQAAVQRDASGVVSTAAAGRLRDAHYQLDASGLYTRTALLEGGRTNLHTRSEEPALWTSTSGATLSAGQLGPDGLNNAVDISDPSAASFSAPYHQIAAFGSDGVKAMQVLLAPGTATRSAFGLLDLATSAFRHLVAVTWNGSSPPTLSSSIGSGAVYAPEQMANGFWRLRATVNGVVAANGHRFYVYPTGAVSVADTGTTRFGGTQVEDSPVVGSYVRTSGATVTVGADSLSLPFSAVPGTMTVYAKFIERGTAQLFATGNRVLHVGSAAAPFFALLSRSGGLYRAAVVTASQTATSDASVVPAIGDVVELRAVLAPAAGDATGTLYTVRLHQALNGGAEVSSALSGSIALPAAWSDTKLWLGSAAGTVAGNMALQAAVVLDGSATLAQCRAA